jgi:hypothetical protein
MAGTEARPPIIRFFTSSQHSVLMMKFVADVMLGRLTRFLRFEGYDVEYDSGWNDETLLRKSRWRILLTKDRGLAARVRSSRIYLVEANGAENQLQEIRKKFPLKNDTAGTRCLVCNTRLRAFPKKKVEHLVPPFVFRKYDAFFVCTFCRRVYWKGTHFERMSRMIE